MLNTMERLLIKGTSKEDMELIAAFATRLGLKAEYLTNEVSYILNEPNIIDDYATLTKAQQDGILAAIDEADRGETFAMEDVLKELRKKYE